MIQDSTIMLDEFSKHFNSRLNTLDFVDNYDKLASYLNRKNSKTIMSYILLPCDIHFEQLISFRYNKLLYNILCRLKIEEESKDNFISEMDITTFSLYETCLLEMVTISTISVDKTDKTIKIECPELLVELLWSPISQFHTSVIKTLEYLNSLINTFNFYNEKTSSHVNKNIFINSKESTPFSYFTLAFVAENLEIPLKI